MDKAEDLSFLFKRIEDDSRLRVTHIALYTAISMCWIRSQYKTEFRISRKELMLMAHIDSIATYHKIMRELIAYGYIVYAPSFHPLQASTVSLIINRKEDAVVS